MEKFCSLSSIEVGQNCLVKSLDQIELPRRKRLIELGFYTGAKIKVIKKTKSVVLLSTRGYTLCVDLSLASQIVVWRDYE